MFLLPHSFKFSASDSQNNACNESSCNSHLRKTTNIQRKYQVFTMYKFSTLLLSRLLLPGFDWPYSFPEHFHQWSSTGWTSTIMQLFLSLMVIMKMCQYCIFFIVTLQSYFSEISVFDLLADDGPSGNLEASPVHEAHVAFSVEGIKLLHQKLKEYFILEPKITFFLDEKK